MITSENSRSTIGTHAVFSFRHMRFTLILICILVEGIVGDTLSGELSP